MSDFETVYAEAYKSGTGQDFTDPEVQDRWQDYHEQLERAFTPTPKTKNTVSGSGSMLPGNYILLSPDVAQDPENRERSIRLCFLGRSLIDLAAKHMTRFLPPEAALDKDEAVAHYYHEVLSSRVWNDAHPEVAWQHDDDADPDIASPTRLEQWPNGEYVNCLGIAIAACGMAEVLGLKYMFGNEIRHTDELTGDLHLDLLRRVEQAVPGAQQRLRDSYIPSILTAWSENGNSVAREVLEELTIVFDDSASSRSSADVRAWHHFISYKFSKVNSQESDPYKLEDCWIQFDPYALTLARIFFNDNEAYRDHIYGTEHMPGDVVLHVESYKQYEDIYRAWHAVLDVFRNEITSLPGSDELQIKTLKDYDWLSEQICRIQRDMWAAFDSQFGGSLSMPQALKHDVQAYSQILMLATYLQDAHDLTISQVVTDPADDRNEPDAVKLTLQEIEATSCGLSTPKKRETVLEAARMILLCDYLSIYGMFLERFMLIKSTGRANVVSELTRPDFMAGAMYLNHYATYRKDGTINIARELAKLTSSQLIWHDARQDPEANGDDGLVQTTDLIRGMPKRLLHTRVQIHRPNPPKTRKG